MRRSIWIITGLRRVRLANAQGMNHGRMSDLQNALNFVSRRIEEEAVRSSRSLTDDQRFLLANLPSEPVLSEAYSVDPDYPPLVTPRDLDYENCAR